MKAWVADMFALSTSFPRWSCVGIPRNPYHTYTMLHCTEPNCLHPFIGWTWLKYFLKNRKSLSPPSIHPYIHKQPVLVHCISQVSRKGNLHHVHSTKIQIACAATVWSGTLTFAYMIFGYCRMQVEKGKPSWFPGWSGLSQVAHEINDTFLATR